MDQADFKKLKHLLEPCQTADELDKYLSTWLNLQLPWDTVDEDSTSAPLKFIWSVYKVLLTGQGPTRHIVAAARNTTKTLSSSTLQFLSMLHFRRDGAHIAAILDQSATAIGYLDQFMNIPDLVPYRMTDNVRNKRFMNLPPNDYTTKNNAALRVVTATKKGANSPRASFLTLDEVDLTPREILSEVAYVADPTRDGHKFDPIFVYLSSRKSNDGPIQDLIDEVEKPSLQIVSTAKLHKWSAVDFMENCPPEVHKPEAGTQTAFLHTETLQVVWDKEQFEQAVPESVRTQYKEISAFEGCKTCPAFIACQGRAPKQQGDSQALRTRKFVGSILLAVKDPSVIIAQTLNWKPETTGLVFKTFSRHKHVKEPIDFYEWITGAPFNPNSLHPDELKRIYEEGTYAELASITPSKAHIYNAMVENGWTIGYGVDWGFSPDPALVIVIGWHKKLRRCAILHMEMANNHANHVWAQYVGKNVHNRFPAEFVAPDMADKASPTYFSTEEFRIPAYAESKPRIEKGVSFIRGLLWNPIAQSSDLAILDDSQMGNNNLEVIESFEHWTHAKTITGKWDMTKFADGDWTHALDALRYVLDPFVEELNVKVSIGQPAVESKINIAAALGDKEAAQILKEKQELQAQFRDHMSREFGIDNVFSKPKDVQSGPLVAPINKTEEPKPKNPRKSGGIRFSTKQN